MRPRGNNLSIKVGNRSLATYEYAANNGYLVKQTDANGNTVTFAYDHLGRVKTASYSGGLVLTYTYNGEGALYSVTAAEDGNTTTYLYGYDSLGRLISGERLDNGVSILRTRQAYDNVNRPVYQAWQVGGTLYEEGYTYNSEEDGSLNTHTTATGETLTMQYDGLRRLSGITGGIYGKTYTYRDISDTQTTTQIASVVYDLPTDQSYGYTYDNMGNIATYTDANGTVTYTYDAQGQLLSATDGTTTYTYTYDTVGNILTANGHTYSYTNADWKDLLTAYDGETITYDAIGNPLSYYNGTRWTFTWEDGRQLATATDGTTNVSYTYDSDGIRTSKTVNGVKHTYVYASGKLLRETYGDTIIDFFYSTSGQPYALSYNGTTYYYITNLQGDVMQIINANGEVVAEYEYDPYGNIISATGALAEVNPLRYRGYIYDSECNLYYLQSRYYDPSIARFLNADSYASTGQGIIGTNMFAYCNNNPATFSDPTGTFVIEITLTAAGTVACVTVLCLMFIQFGAQTISSVINWLSRQWFFAFAQIRYTTVDEPELQSTQKAASQQSVAPGNSDDDDDDDDYYDNDSNFGGRQRIGRSKGKAPRNNQAQNEQTDSIARKKGFSRKKADLFHRSVNGQGYSYGELLGEADALDGIK